MSVFNPALFIGEPIVGATAGVPLSADANGNLVSGQNAIEVSSAAQATTTSATNAVLTGMSISAAPGTYLFIFSTSIQSNNAGAQITLGAYNNGVLIPQSVRFAAPFDGGALSATQAISGVTINGIVTITTGALAIQWNTSGGTATAGQRTFNMLRIL